MIKTFMAAVLCAGTIMLGGLAPVQAAEAEYKLRFADLGTPKGPRGDAIRWWAAELNKRSNGRIEIEFYWSQSLVKAKDTMKAIGSGLAEMGTVLGIYAPAQLPIWNYSNTPFIVSDIWVGMRTWYELRQTRPELREEAARHNIKILGQFSTGSSNIISVKSKITNLEELQGKKIRATGGYAKLLKALGAVPVGLGYTEVYTAMERGTVDGSVTFTPSVKTYKQYEVASHVTETQLGQILGFGPAINLDFFNRMPKDLQKILVDTTSEMIDEFAKNFVTQEQAIKAELIAGIDGHKVVFHSFSEEERERWKAPMKEVTAEWKAKMAKIGIDADAFIADFERIRDRYKAEVKAKGYPWER